MIVTESVIDAAALWSAGLRQVIPANDVNGLTDEIITHLVECRVKRVVLMMDADEAGRAAAVEMAQRLAAANIWFQRDPPRIFRDFRVDLTQVPEDSKWRPTRTLSISKSKVRDARALDLDFDLWRN